MNIYMHIIFIFNFYYFVRDNNDMKVCLYIFRFYNDGSHTQVIAVICPETKHGFSFDDAERQVLAHV